MGVRVRPKLYTQRSIDTNSDQVIGMVVLPPESRLNGLSGRCNVMSETRVLVKSACFYGLHAYVLPILAPDATITPDAIWDNQVPKDKPLDGGAAGVSALDMDLDTADPTPAFEIGEPSVEAMIGLGDAPDLVFSRTRMLTFMDPGAKGFDLAALTYTPTDQFKLGITHPVRVDIASICIFGFSSPQTTTTATAYFVPDTDAEWATLHYLEWALMQSFIHLIGLFEAGAETPYVDAATLVALIIENTFEQTGGAFAPVSFTVISEFTWDITMNGDMQKAHISGQR